MGIPLALHGEPFHWLTGGAFQRVYEELEILPEVKLRTLETWTTYSDVREHFDVVFTRDLDGFCEQLKAQQLSRPHANAVDLRAGPKSSAGTKSERLPA